MNAQVLTSNYCLFGGVLCIDGVRVATGDGILNSPIIATWGEVSVKGAKFPNHAMARISRVGLSYGKGIYFDGGQVVRFIKQRVLMVLVGNYRCLNGNFYTWYSFPGRVFFTKADFRLSTYWANSFLATIVLLFRRRVRLVRPVRPNSVLLVVVFREL